MSDLPEFSNDELAFEPLIRDEYSTPQTCRMPPTA